MELFDPKNVNFNFAKHFKLVGIISILLTIVGALSLIAPGINYGIDFRGGVATRVMFKDTAIQESAIREALGEKLKNLSVVRSLSQSGEGLEFNLTAQGDSKDQTEKILLDAFTVKFGAKGEAWNIQQFEVVGPRVSSGLRKNAILSLLYASILICLYMYWRFDIRYSPGAIASIFHDLSIAVLTIVALRMEFTVTLVAALLTLAGYSINDTVVVYDRIRELEHKHKGKDQTWLVNHAINSTLSRTILTAGTTLVSCVVLYIFGNQEIKDFATVLFVGILVGTYSSAFVATPLYVWANKKFGKNFAS